MSDGSAGVNFEHSAVDGHTALRFVSDIFADTVVQFAQSITSTIYSKDHIPALLDAVVRRDASTFDSKPKRLDFEFPTSTLDDIYYAETLLGDQLLQSETHVLEFRDYGKKFITQNKMSPDSFVQMSMLLAYYRLYGEFVCA
jgi:carnitine O-acetyltransferase